MAKQQKIEIANLSKEYSTEELNAIGQDFIDYIIKRTQDGKGVNGNKWKGSKANEYSKAYRNSLDFKIGGKGSTVNLELSGDMLSMLEVLSVKKGKIVIGYEDDDKLNGKVEGNRIGSYGRDPNPKKARDFLEIGSKDRSQILSKYPVNDEEKRQERASIMNALIAEGRTYQARLIEDMAEED
jgi:hypothetical protein